MARVFKANMDRLCKSLIESLSDYDLDIQVVNVAQFISHKIYVIEVKINDDLTLAYTYDHLTNGAHGINERILIEIRQALGEDIEMPPLKPGFDDIITYEKMFT